MKKIFYIIFLIISTGSSTILQSCKENIPILSGIDCSIISMTLHDNGNGQECPVLIYEDSLVALSDYNFSLSDAKPTYTLSEGATISPDPVSVKDWSVPMTFTVTSYNKEFCKNYTYNIRYVSSYSRCDMDMYFTCQQEVDEFGSHGYTSVRSITVNGTEETPVTDLSPLSSLKEIDHNLTIKGYQGQEVMMDGLTKLSTLDISSDSVTHVSFNSLQSIDNLMLGYLNEEFLYEMKPLVLQLLSFKSLREVTDNLVVYIQSCEGPGFPALESCGGDMIYITSGTRDMVSNNDMSIFPELKTVTNLQLGGMSLSSLNGTQNLKTVSGLLKIEFLPEITTFLPFCPDSVGMLQINSCQGLTDLDAFSNLKNITTLSISGVPNLENIDGISGIQRIESGFFLRSTNRLTDLNALSGIEYIGRTITIQNNRALEDFSGLKKCLRNFEGTWDVQGNKSNPSIEDILNEE